jgi:PAS domain S-box-containing protein
VGFGVGVGLSVLAALVATWWLRQRLLEPIRAVTEAATAIGGGQLHLIVPVQTHDEVGQLAEAFNAMTAKLRAYRQTDTERLLRARQTGQATIDSFPDPVVVIDILGRVEVANPTAQRLFGVRPPRDGEQLVVWTPPESLRQAVEEAVRHQQVVAKETFDQAVTFRLDGEDRVYLPQVRPIRSSEGELLGAAVVLNDVTRFRLLDRLKSDWVATVSHELKTPLTSVRLAVHVLLEEVVGSLEPKQVELLIEARENTERLLKLIEHLLSLARLEDGREQLDLRPTDPAILLRAAADDAASRADDKRVEIAVEDALELPAVVVDPVRFGRALNNLLDNAVTYTEPGGKVTLSASATDDGRVRLTVSDTGIGIPPEYLPHIFDRFFRVPGRDGTPGTGLGLAIVREIVVAHRGDIDCASKPGLGTTFHITLPTRKVGA